MGNLNRSWFEKMASLGWRPSNMELQVQKYLGKCDLESIIGVINSGDKAGSLIGVSTSHVKDAKRIEKTIIGFTVGGDNSIRERSIVVPDGRINGCLIITLNKFIACGYENYEFSFSDIIVASGVVRTRAAADYDLQKMGIGNYSYSGDIYVSKLEINRQENLNCGYDDLTISFVLNGRSLIGNDIGGMSEVWYQLERTIITKE